MLGESQKKRENTTCLTIFRGTPNATKRCVVKWLQAAVCKEYHSVPCARDEQCQHAHYQHNPYSVGSVRSSTMYYLCVRDWLTGWLIDGLIAEWGWCELKTRR